MDPYILTLAKKFKDMGTKKQAVNLSKLSNFLGQTSDIID